MSKGCGFHLPWAKGFPCKILELNLLWVIYFSQCYSIKRLVQWSKVDASILTSRHCYFFFFYERIWYQLIFEKIQKVSKLLKLIKYLLTCFATFNILEKGRTLDSCCTSNDIIWRNLFEYESDYKRSSDLADTHTLSNEQWYGTITLFSFRIPGNKF